MSADASIPLPCAEPSPTELDNFKDQLKKWMEVNNAIRELQTQMKELRRVKKNLSLEIAAFMGKHRYQSLNLKEGKRLMYKMSYVNAPLPQSIIRERLESVLHNTAPEKCMEMSASVFRREVVPKPTLSLRRIKVT